MPWQDTDITDQRRQFIKAWLTHRYNVTFLCKVFAVSRKTGHKWIKRFKAEGMINLSNKSTARLTQAHRTPSSVVQVLLDTKLSFPDWGPRKVAAHLRNTHPNTLWPAHSTVSRILSDHGLVKPRGNRRYKAPARTAPLSHATAPNVVWSVDFKGDFLLGDAVRCYPLTVFDNHSRYLLACKGLHSTKVKPVIKVFEGLFTKYGLPDYIRSDNGNPFASTRLGGLSYLSLWFLKLGILPERIRPGCPQENGRHERFHRSLKAAVCNPSKGNMSAQQRAFNQYQHSYNQLRPHESLGDQPPASVYIKSQRTYTGEQKGFTYPDNFEVRKVRLNGDIKWHQKTIYVANLLAGEHVGLEEIDDCCWVVYLSTIKLGILDTINGKIIRPGH